MKFLVGGEHLTTGTRIQATVNDAVDAKDAVRQCAEELSLHSLRGSVAFSVVEYPAPQFVASVEDGQLIVKGAFE